MIKRIRQAAFFEGITGPRVWSVMFDPDSDSPVGMRVDMASGMVAEVAVGSEKVRNDFDEISIFKRPLFNATWNDMDYCWEDLVERGEEGFTLSPTEEGREVVYRSTPFWYRLELSDTGRICYVSVSESELAGYKLAPMFRDGNTPVYRSVFEAAIDENWDGLIHSRAGFIPVEASPDDWRDHMNMRAEKACSESGAEWFSDYLLLLVEFATLNLQSVMHGVCDDPITLFNGWDVDGSCPEGLYTKSPSPYIKGDRVVLLADFGAEELSYYGEYTVSEVAPYGGVGDRLVFEGLDLEDLFLRTFGWKVFPARARTGEAISAVTNASSGCASARHAAPIVWRGKENPWGNTSTLLTDYAVKIKREGNAQLYHLNSESFLDFFCEESYSTCGEEYPFPVKEDSFVMGMAASPEKNFLYPVLFDDTALDRYFTTRCSRYGRNKNKDLFCVITVGGGNKKALGTNFATMEFVNAEAHRDKWSRIGGRLAFKEG